MDLRITVDKKKSNLRDLRNEHSFWRQPFHLFSHLTLSCTMPE